MGLPCYTSAKLQQTEYTSFCSLLNPHYEVEQELCHALWKQPTFHSSHVC
jgi:hypothetical protein